MTSWIIEKLRGARRIGLYSAVAVFAVLALILVRGERSAPTGQSSLEQRMENILSKISGTGRVTVMVNEGPDGESGGMVIVADGLTDINTYLQVQRAACALSGFEVSRIAIIGRNGAFEGGT